jgi:hypothetical protein
MGATKPLEYYRISFSLLASASKADLAYRLPSRPHSANGVRLLAGIKLSRTGRCHGRRNKVLTTFVLLIMNWRVISPDGRPGGISLKTGNVVLIFATHRIAITILQDIFFLSYANSYQ